jgi:hypothetical protein
MLKSGGEMTAGAFEFAALQLDFGELGLRPFGDLGGQFAEAGQPCQQPHRFAETALFLTARRGSQEMIDEIQRCLNHTCLLAVGPAIPWRVSRS